jgi:hypothetical protein
MRLASPAVPRLAGKQDICPTEDKAGTVAAFKVPTVPGAGGSHL